MPHWNDADFPNTMSEDLKEQYRRQFMKQEDTINAVVDFIRGLNVDQLAALQVILNQMTDTDTGPSTASHYLGWVCAAIQFNHSSCHICAKPHSVEELMTGVHSHPDEVKVDSSVPPWPEVDLDRNYAYPPGVEPHLTVEDVKNMEEYNLDALYEHTDQGASHIGFACKHCELRYISIEDRMLKAPDQCHGCHQKSMWG